MKVPVGRELLSDPLSHFSGLFEKEGWVSRGEYPIRIRWTSIPAYLPEVGCLISLETTSPDIAADFIERKRGEVAIVKLHNFDPLWRRAVSWGCYEFKPLKELKRVYSTALFLDLILTPSAETRRAMISPLRYFPLECKVPLYFKCLYSYNAFLAFVNPAERRGEKEVWLGQSVKVVPVKVREIELEADGWMKGQEIYLCFEKAEFQEFQEWGSAGYYFCLAEGFNDYRGGRSPGRHINIARVLYPLVHSPYDIMPLLFPKVIPEREDLVMRFSVPTESLVRILYRLRKFEGIRGTSQLEEFGKLYLGLAKVEEKEGKTIYEAVNPTLVATLTRKALECSGMEATLAKEALSKPWELIDRVKEWERTKRDWEVDLLLLGVGEHLNMKAKNYSLLRREHDTIEED